MIDTVVLALDITQIRIPESLYDAFTPSARGFFQPPFMSFGRQKLLKCVLNPTLADKKKGLYLPRITLFKGIRSGKISIFMHIEFSAPKILYNNNFDELTDDDFDELCRILAKRLQGMGLYVFSALLERAEVKAIHYGKNIVIDDYSTASSIISYIAKSNISTHKNADIRAYKNEGETVHFFTTNWGLAIYDKILELKKSKKTEKGRIEKDNYCQLSLFDYKSMRKPFEVVRVEARYNDRKAIKNMLAKTNLKVESYEFKDLYSSKIAKTALKHEMSIIGDNIMGISRNSQSLLEFATEVIALNPKATMAAKMKAIAVKTLFVETGSRDIRKLIGATPSQWSRLVKDMSKLRYQQSEFTGFDKIYKSIEEFKPVKLENYKNEI